MIEKLRHNPWKKFIFFIGEISLAPGMNVQLDAVLKYNFLSNLLADVAIASESASACESPIINTGAWNHLI